MTRQMSFKQLEQQIAQLPLQEQLRLIARISEQLSAIAPDRLLAGEESTPQHRGRVGDELLALCDAAAEMWEGEFDAAKEIRQMRKERND